MTDPTPPQPAGHRTPPSASADTASLPHARLLAEPGEDAARRLEEAGPVGGNGDTAGPATGHGGTVRYGVGTGSLSHAERLRFIGSATRRIARGNDLDEIVLGLCRATVQTFADAILVYLQDPLPVGDEAPPDRVVLRLRRIDRLPENLARIREESGGGTAEESVLPAWSGANPRLELDPTGPLGEVLRAVRPVFAESPTARAALRELTGSIGLPEDDRAIIAPLRGRRRVIGVTVLLRRAHRDAFERDDLQVAQQLATHAALGVDKAVLYGREASIADELQRTMLPDTLPPSPGVKLTRRYAAAAQSARVGGDWYDAIPLPRSRVALVVGDVMGHSTTSAAIMGQLRTTVQTLAGLDLPPQEVLHHLEEQAQRLGSDRMATCLYAVYDPVERTITAANAGHPPPVMLFADGTTELIELPPNAPIGVGGVDFEPVEDIPAPPGSTLVLYTDGLVESRTRDVMDGVAFLREKLTDIARMTRPGAAVPLEPMCDEILDIVGPGDRDDDIALLVARLEGIAQENVAALRMPPAPESVRDARRLVRESLRRWELEDLLDSAELLVSEVVTNAVRYAERPVTLRLLRSGSLRCEVGDDVPLLPRPRRAGPDEEGGRGLFLVEELARTWGATRLGTGKVVWFEMDLPPGAAVPVVEDADAEG
ncbi:SpoIIE family protein phosphatase [Streptomyces sp. ST2-7A]|uniref:ATP-binding SpoIIE family protein phosphatase n=1 Tax=Streptomyces sp. ST2-7A TaxID=2907214 RepID=UPI0027E245CB|nr:SpoIIE family protein phosphatase [Streptomyces sp. ST2-7A]